VALSYDSADVLAAFADRHGITYPLLSDAGSRIIDAWGLRNQSARGREAGIPHPGTFIVNRQLRVVERAFEQAYQERTTAAGILARIGGAVAPAVPANLTGGQVTATLGVSDATVAPGGRVTLIIDLKPKPKMHVYAPGQQGYTPVAVTLDPTPDIKPHSIRFPPPGTYFFAPLKETVKVYDRPTRLTQEVTVGLSQDLRRRAAAKELLVITGSLAYQACDDKVCYRQETLPLSWSLTLTPFVRGARD
jgi:hypothetical protein